MTRDCKSQLPFFSLCPHESQFGSPRAIGAWDSNRRSGPGGFFASTELWNTGARNTGFGARSQGIHEACGGLFEVNRHVNDRELRLPFAYPRSGSAGRTRGLPLQWGSTIGWRRLLYPTTRTLRARRYVRPPHRFGKSRFRRRSGLQKVRERLERADLHRRALFSALQNFLSREVRLDARAWTSPFQRCPIRQEGPIAEGEVEGQDRQSVGDSSCKLNQAASPAPHPVRLRNSLRLALAQFRCSTFRSLRRSSPIQM